MRGSNVRCDECPQPEILPENEGAVALYLATQTQWRTGFDGRRSGLRYEGVAARAAHMTFNDEREAWSGLAVIEREIIKADRERT